MTGPDALLAETHYGKAIQLSHDDNPVSVTAAYRAALAAYRWHDSALAPCDRKRAREVYDSSLTLLLENSQRFCRFHPVRGIGLDTAAGVQWIPIDYQGFRRPAEDFNRIHTVGDYDVKELNQQHTRCGFGTPIVVERIRPCPSRFLPKDLRFAATAMLVPDVESSGDSGTLTLVSPNTYEEVEVAGRTRRLAADFSAPLAFVTYSRGNRGLQSFLQPGATDQKAQLFVTEPYDPDKIPIIFIHGLLSDPITWVTIANELRGDPWFRERFQLWAFQYPTGEAFLDSAAKFRKELNAAIARFTDKQGQPRRDIVLVGHSMGGLVAKLQTSDSGDQLWAVTADRPIEALNASQQEKERLRSLFYFQANPSVSRVIFIGTPHGGSNWARRTIGRIGARLVRQETDESERYQELLRDNPDVIAPYLQQRLPTSVDLLSPDNPLLQAMRRLQIEPRVRVHSVIGRGRKMICSHEDSDGVVSVESATHRGAINNTYVEAEHGTIHRHPFAIRSIMNTLRTHWTVSQAEADSPTDSPPVITVESLRERRLRGGGSL